jgi:imidazole glycerol phosphate synthase subunit HisF
VTLTRERIEDIRHQGRVDGWTIADDAESNELLDAAAYGLACREAGVEELVVRIADRDGCRDDYESAATLVLARLRAAKGET